MKDICSYNIDSFEALLREAEKPIIVTHMKPDGDAMGSSIAMAHFMSMYGKEARIVINDRYPSYLSFLTGNNMSDRISVCEENIKEAEDIISGSDLIICLDFNSFHRTDKMEKMLSQAKGRKILIDHHLNPDTDSFDLVFSETEISSASELLYHILMATSVISSDAGKLPSECATALMTGMTTDTNNFANSVFPSTLHMASALLAAGVDRDKILSNIYNQYSEERMRLMGHMLKDLMRITGNGVAYMVLDRKTQEEYHISEGDTEGFVNLPLSIGKVRMSILAKEDTDRIRISIRSKKGTSANMCARMYFNGGGHENAAGGRLIIPDNVKGIYEVAEYIEKHTELFFR